MITSGEYSFDTQKILASLETRYSITYPASYYMGRVMLPLRRTAVEMISGCLSLQTFQSFIITSILSSLMEETLVFLIMMSRKTWRYTLLRLRDTVPTQ